MSMGRSLQVIMAETDSHLIQNSNLSLQTVGAKHLLSKYYARPWMSLVLLLTDSIALLLSLLIAVNVQIGSIDSLDNYFYVSFLWLPVLLLIIIFSTFGLYPAIGISAVEEVRRLSVSTSLLFLIVTTITFLLKTSESFSRIVFILAWLIALIFLPLARSLIRWICVRLKIWGEPVAIVGFPDRRVVEVADFFTKFPHKGLMPRVIYLEEDLLISKKTSYDVLSTQTIGNAKFDLPIKTVLVVVPDWNWVGENIDKYRFSFERIILIQPQRAHFSLSDSVALDFNGVMGFQVHHNLLNPWAMLFKRIVDLVVSSILMVALAPLIGVVSVLIHFDSPGGVYYRQERLGKGGKVFQALKFRTMYINGDQIFAEKLKNDKALQEEWKKYQKLKSDPRITRVGGFLRKYSIDELPQAWNIFLGQMSLVGPRPIMVSQQDMYGLPYHDYCQVRPGVTGLWQVSGRNLTTFARRAELDMEYIQRWSLWLDLYIIFQTVREVLSKKGAY
jgi:Undecaprenyl-phosphate galactose phosphotransferase WbaP